MQTVMRALLLAGLLIGSTALGTPAYGQDAPAKPAPGETVSAPAKEAIIVSGERAEKPAAPPPLSADASVVSRVAVADAHQFVRCVGHIAPKLLRPIVEGVSRDAAAQRAMDRVIRVHVGCYPGYARSPLPNYYGRCNPVLVISDFRQKICRATFDRGALIESAVAEYAPHFLLTRADTLSKATIERFQAREKLRGKYRGPTDRRTYLTIACMVQLEPEKATRLLRAEPGGNIDASLRAQILEGGKLCTGGTNNASVDPFMFRGYVADAFYHWTVAAKNVETLFPSS